jgi:molecular chaperone GrpE
MVLIYNKLIASCTSKGLEAMHSVGNPFNSDVMEAITHIPSPSEDMKGKVVDDIEKGYKLGDKVIRFAKVIVGN